MVDTGREASQDVAASQLGSRAASRLGWLLAILAAGLLALATVIARAPGGPATWDPVGDATGFLLFALVGAAIVSRRPGNAVGWVMIGAGMCFVLDNLGIVWVEAALAGWDLPATTFMAWLASWVWSPAWGLAFAWLPFLFPDGRPLNRRWRWLGVLLVLGTMQLIPAMLMPQLEYGDEGQVYGPNPIGLDGHEELLDAIIDGIASVYIPIWVAIIVMQVLRYRRSDRIGRLQLRWFLFGITLVIGTIVLTVSPALEAVFSTLPFSVPVSIIPLSVGIAVTRYRLYEIDRIISRTVTFAVVSALLAGLYIAGVLGLGRLLGPFAPDSDLAVALATLLAAAAFRPLLVRVRARVERRFDRHRYDAAAEVAAFGHRLRDEVDLEQVSRELARVAGSTVQPTAAGVWLPSG